MSNPKPLCNRLADPSRPVFLLGDVPPGEGTPPGKCQEIANKFLARSRPLATDGFIVYDIQDEPGRTDMDRPFPFRRVMDSSAHAALLARSSGRECLVYKCVADANFDDWLQTAKTTHGHSAINLVGRASSEGKYEGPTIAEAMQQVSSEEGVDFGCVCIAERHTIESAKARGKSYPTEHMNMIRKVKAGAKWFISQAVYDAEPTIRLLKDYAVICKQQGISPQKVVLTFAPVSRKKTMNFIKWLGVRVPGEAEKEILEAEKPVEKSISFLCDLLKQILAECAGVGVPLGISCESVSIFKSEIDGVHELFRRLQCILLDSRGSPWKVSWIEVMPPAGKEDDKEDEKNLIVAREMVEHDQRELMRAGGSQALLGVLVGAGVCITGMLLGASKKR
mmetsp:Transcript_21868/g.37528  ORF Transcript_21868/g.37528 Transcript_21868/m.37528 type:complete len:393 (-) Transcript_21868:1215-2393(-)|eukprot:CAMPEP_0183772336 /NCGR_PEP_ID=MMETSP0739-20130205/35646_1 /TAXON_ID=385413 /ORGANISM="Thalassiosira miniscula, Strain CCMP1093" /LENGTH=392 /DNA_ID=CAMNT_0026013007 /DNA_START=7 /DNA_END=1185 /DNA_ORIENTATION=-